MGFVWTIYLDFQVIIIIFFVRYISPCFGGDSYGLDCKASFLDGILALVLHIIIIIFFVRYVSLCLGVIPMGWTVRGLFLAVC